MSFLKNGWYVAAWDSEVGNEPVHQRVLGENIVLFRDEQRKVIALSDMCPHRFAPLHKGKVCGNAIQCPYHGLQFDAEGTCIGSPFQDQPPAASVRSFPIVERDRFIWIWMGERNKADPSQIPDFSPVGDSETFTCTKQGKLEMNLSYELILDNLMDLSHGQFLHPTTLGNQAMARGTTTDQQTDRTVSSVRFNPRGAAPTLFIAGGAAQPGQEVDFWNSMRWTAPSIYFLRVAITEPGAPEESGPFLGSVHCLTPVSETRTVYRYTLWRTFSRDNQQLTDAIDAVVHQAFTTEDEPMITEVQARMNGRDFWSMRPLILATDRAGVLVRRKLQTLIREEQRANSVHAGSEGSPAGVVA